MARRDPQSLKTLLPDLLGRMARESGRARHLQPLWREAVGDAIARAAKPVALEGGTLVVQVPTPEWARELEAKSAEIVARLQERLGKDLVRGLRATVASA